MQSTSISGASTSIPTHARDPHKCRKREFFSAYFWASVTAVLMSAGKAASSSAVTLATSTVLGVGFFEAFSKLVRIRSITFMPWWFARRGPRPTAAKGQEIQSVQPMLQGAQTPPRTRRLDATSVGNKRPRGRAA